MFLVLFHDLNCESFTLILSHIEKIHLVMHNISQQTTKSLFVSDSLMEVGKIGRMMPE